MAHTKQDKDVLANITHKLEDRLTDMVEKSIKIQRKKAQVPVKGGKPTQEELEDIINNYAGKSATLAAGFALIPGPLGVLALFKELQSILQTQVDLVAHLSLRLKKQEEVTTEMVVNMLATALGNVGITLLVNQSGKIVLQRLSKHAAKSLGSRLLQKGGASVLAKWIPLAGSGLMYKHTYGSTKELGERTLKLLSQGHVVETEAVS